MFNLFVFFSLDRNKRYKMLKLSSEIVTERQTTIFRRTTIVTALADEDTLFQTHCCGHIVTDTNVFLFAHTRNICCGHKNVSDFVQKHFVPATNVSQFARPKKHHGQHCVRNNVSLFTRALTVKCEQRTIST